MYVEKFLKVDYTIWVPIYEVNYFPPVTNVTWRYKVIYEYWLDGRKLLIGSFTHKPEICILDVETTIFAVTSDNKTKTVEQAVSFLKRQLETTKRNINEVIRDFKNRHFGIELWQVSII